MSKDLIYEAITLLSDEVIDEAADYAPMKKPSIRWKRWAALAACCVLVVGIGAFAMNFIGGKSANGTAPQSPGNAMSGTDGSSTFMSYAGPVFPLTTTDDAQGVTVQRDITLDFAPWVPTWLSNEEEAAARTDLTEEERADVLADYNKWYPEGGRYQSSSHINVTDKYTLTNTTTEEQTISVLYPFTASLRNLSENTPTLTVGGAETDTTLHIGGYSGGFQQVAGSTSEELLNLEQLNSWTQYKALLEDGSYLARALGEGTDLTGIPVTVYKFTDPWGDPESSDKPNPSIRVTFDRDAARTKVLSYGFHSGSYQENRMGLGFSIREPHQPGYGEPYYIIVLGDDVKNMETGGYVTGGWDTQKKLDDFSVHVERYETDLDLVLREVVELRWRELTSSDDPVIHPADHLDFDTYYALFCDHLTTYGVLSETGVERYGTGRLDDMDVESVDRVCYLRAAVTVPAGGSVKLTAAMKKQPSYDYYCAHRSNQNVNGYDMVTRLGSTLHFTGQSATLLDHGQIELVRQNFGFDPAAGITTVTLDPGVEHYYLEVTKAKRE